MGLLLRRGIATVAVSCFLIVLSVYGYLGYIPTSAASGTLAATGGSWNPSVNCTPIVVTIEQVLGSQTNSMGGATGNGSMFYPGTTSPVGSAKRWLTPGPTPPGWVSPGPPCTITNANGQVVSAFVEIHHIQRMYLKNEDYAIHYDPVNGGGSYPTGMNLSDTTFNAFTPGYATCISTNTTGCMHTIHMEFDHDWKAAGYCGPNTACDPHAMAQATPAEPSPNCQKTPVPSACFIDVQGYVFWDSEAASAPGAWHSFSGWEVHPLTAWRISTTSPDFSLSASPSSLAILPGQSASSAITVDSLNSFTGSISFTATVVSQSNSSAPAPVVTMNPSTVTVSASGMNSSTLSVTTASSDTGDYAVTVTGTSGNLSRSMILSVDIVDFSIVANPSSLAIPIGSSRQSTLTLAGINGFSGSIGLTANVSPTSLTGGLSLSDPTASLSASNVALTAGGTAAVTLTVSASLLTTPGTYAVSVSATSGGLTHTTVVNITVTLV